MLTIPEPKLSFSPVVEDETVKALSAKDADYQVEEDEEEMVVVEDYLIEENFEISTTEVQPSVKTDNQMKIHTCQICCKVYDKKASYMYHMKTKHQTDRPHECENCGKRFAIRADLVRHARIHTNEKRFVCSSCGKRFTDRSTHLKHEKMHSGIKPYSCTTCGKSFPYSFALKSHELTHTGVKNFP